MEVEKWWVFAATVDSYLMAAKWMVFQEISKKRKRKIPRLESFRKAAFP